MNPELDLDENDNGEEADLDDRMDHIAAVDMGLTAHRDDHRDDLANRTNRTRANDPARRSGPPPSVPRNPIEPDHGRGGDGDEDSPDGPARTRWGRRRDSRTERCQLPTAPPGDGDERPAAGPSATAQPDQA